MAMETALLFILALIFPPLPVWIRRGICSADSLINIALSCFGYLPGLIHAIYIISTYPQENIHNRYERLDSEQGNNARIYVYTATYPSAAAHTQRKPQGQQGQTGRTQYGTVSTSNNSNNNNKDNNNAGADASSGAGGPQFLPNVAPAGEGSSSNQEQQQPPSYNDAIKGDNKVQSQD